MSDNWAKDIHEMHTKFGVNEWMKNKLEEGDKDMLRRYMAFRLSMIHEEFKETSDAAIINGNAEEVVDGLIDLCVFAIGTLDVMGVDANEAWNRVFEANMEKSPGVKWDRPNPWGLPDLMKPYGWKPPSHAGNHGHLEKILK